MAANQDLRGKIETFQTANLVWMARLEVAGFSAVMRAFLTGTSYLLGIIAIVLLVCYLL